MPSRTRRRRLPDAEGTAQYVRRLIYIWSAVLSVVVVVGLGLAVWLWVRPGGFSPVAGTAGENGSVVSTVPAPLEDEAVELVRQAMGVKEAGDVAGYFHPGTREASEVAEFLQGVKAVDGKLTGLNWLGSMNANGLSIEGVLLVYETPDGALRNRLALLTPDDEGVWKVDFEAFARSVDPSWDDLLSGKSDTGRVRVIVAADTYYNGPFSDEAQWRCYAMGSPDLEVMMSGYCRKGTAQAEAMEYMLRKDPKDEAAPGGRNVRRATLEIVRREGSEPRQFEITRVLAEDWVVSSRALDEKFEAQ